jgi:hypothetical protein
MMNLFLENLLMILLANIKYYRDYVNNCIFNLIVKQIEECETNKN